jgi:hypothetical protein
MIFHLSITYRTIDLPHFSWFLFTSFPFEGYFNFLPNPSLPFISLLSPSLRRTGFHFPNSDFESMRITGESPYLPLP